GFQQVVADVASVHVRADQQVGRAFQRGVGQGAIAQAFVQSAVGMHFTVYFQVRGLFLNQPQGFTHFGAGSGRVCTKVGARQQGHLGFQTQRAQHTSSFNRVFRNFLCVRVVVDVRVGQ